MFRVELIAFVAAIAAVGALLLVLKRRRALSPHGQSGLIGDRTRVIATQSDATLNTEMKRVAPLLSSVVENVGRGLRPGMTTLEVHDRVMADLRALDLEPAMLGYHGYPAGAAVSVNEQVVHALPGARRLQAGDVVTIDTSGASSKAFAGQAWTFPVGGCDEEAQALLNASKRALRAALSVAKVGSRIGDIGAAIQREIEAAGFTVVRDYVGYAIGRERMMGPQIPCFGRPGLGMRLRVGQVLNLYVIAKVGTHALTVEDDGWTTRSTDGGRSVVVTAMVAVGESGSDSLSALIDMPAEES